jgi:hypothetical protein
MTANKVFLNNQGIIEIHVVGDQTVLTIRAMGLKTEKLIEKLRAENKQVLVLDVLLEMGNVPPEGRKSVVKLATELDYDKAAMLGSSAALRLGANLMLRATGRNETAKYFENREDAVIWLLG